MAFALGWLGYSLLVFRRDRRLLAASIVGLGVAALGARMVLPDAFYSSLLRFSAGRTTSRWCRRRTSCSIC